MPRMKQLLLLWMTIAALAGEEGSATGLRIALTHVEHEWGVTEMADTSTRLSPTSPTRRRSDRKRDKMPQFVSSPSNVTAFPGDEVLLPCAVEGIGHYTVIWLRSDEVPYPLFIGVDQFTLDDRFRLLHEGSHGANWNLQLNDVREIDQGVYECQVNTPQLMRHSVFLRVPPFIHVTPAESSVEAGSVVRLLCNASQPPLQWFKDGVEMDTSGSSGLVITNYVKQSAVSELIIDRARPRDGGTYVCRAPGDHARSAVVHVWNGTAPQPVVAGGSRPRTLASLASMLAACLLASSCVS